MKEFTIRTKSRTEMINIDSQVMSAIKDSGVSDGICLIFVPHTTAAVTINENADPAVRYDIMAKLNKLVPPGEGYTHLEGNADAHIKASMIGSSVSIIISNGRAMFGTWQSVFFCEFDGPRTRKVWITIKGK